VEGVLAADATSLREMLRWPADGSMPSLPFQRFSLKAQTAVTGRNIALAKVNLELDGNSGEGVLTYVADSRRVLQGTLAVDALNLTPYVSTLRLLTSARSWNRVPLELDAFSGIDVDLRISAAKVTIDNFSLGQTAIAAGLRAGNLTLAIGECQAFGGIIKGSLALAKSTVGADLSAQLQFDDVMLDQTLGAFFGVRRVEGRGTIRVAVRGSGRSVYDVTKALNGTISMTSQKGAIAGLNVEQSLKRLERNPLSVRSSDFRGGRTPYDELSVTLKVTDGIAHAQEIRVEAPALRVGLAGTTSIPARAFDLKGTASLVGSGANDTFQLPFVVMGSWDDPLFWPDIQMLIRRSGAAAPLLDAVRNRLTRDRLQSFPDSPAPAAVPPPTAD
jgi:AsmA protein